VIRKLFIRVGLGLVMIGVNSPLWAQTDPTSAASATPADSGAMVAPAPLSGEGYSLEFASEEPRTNYLRGGLVVGAAYDDDVLSSSSGSALSDVSYTVSPTVALDLTRSHFHWNLSYAPGYVFYQKYSSLDQANQNVATKFSYRLSPHVTFTAQEVFSKTSGGYAQPCESQSGSLCGSLDSPNSSVVAPITDTLNDATNAQITYQFSPGGMIGATGNFSELRYPDQAEAPGLYGSSATGGSVFYTHRLSGKHYVGATYQYQKYLSHSSAAVAQVVPATVTQSLMLFYTLYLQHSISFSLFGGPQYSDTYGLVLPIIGALPASHSWSPGGGASVNWQGQHNSLLASYSRRISDGGGLQGAVSFNGANAAIHHKFSPSLSGTISADYSVNKILDATVLDNSGGHTVSGTCTLERAFGEHFNMVAGYLRMHQSYDIPAISIAPNRDRVWLSVGYQFQRSLGR
jgi:hypothetical protein